MKVKYQSEVPWQFELCDYLVDRELAYTDVTEAVMYVKNDPTDADGSALVSKTLTGSDISWNDDNDALIVDINISDYGSGKMEIDGNYYVYLGLTATGYTSAYLEPTLRSHQIEIIQDGIRG